MEKLWQELKRRNVLRVATVYAMAAWIVIQVAVAVFPYLGLPTWLVTAVIVLTLVGFPIALIISWVYEWGPEGVVRTEDIDDTDAVSRPVPKRSWGGTITIGALAVLLVGQYFYFKHWKAEQAPMAAMADNTRSLAVAVLPFVNMSSDPEQEYFSDGLTEDIITQLAKIKDLHVISRTSSMKYKGDTLSIKTIGAQLNVGTILEGSVQRAGDQLRITAQLIDVATDAHLWAESYDRPVADLFSIQREIATTIAGMLKQTLTPDDVNSLAAVPTENVEAYQAYLKGRHLTHQAHVDGETTMKAIVELERAVAMDSTFALAYAELARAHARVYYLRMDQSEARRSMASQAADRALALAPENPEVHLAIGDHFNWAFRDRTKAMEHWAIAEKGLPNNAEVLIARAGVLMTEGHLDESIRTLEKATLLSPKDVNAFSDLAWGYMWAHRFSEAIAAADKAIGLAPEQNWPYLYRGISYYSWKGPCPEARTAFASVDKEYGWYKWAMYILEAAEGRIDEAFRVVSGFPDGMLVIKTEVLPASLYEAFLLQHQGEKELAQKKYKEAVKLLEKELPAHPADARYHSALGMALAGAGQKERAIAMALKATELLPYAKDMAFGINPIYDLAVTYTLVGDFDKAFTQLDFNLSNPGFFTVERMKGDVRYDVLRNDPRYAALLKKHALPQVPA
jgi:TolB-like protein/tetratricopeptide (TPR) repeat protein